MKWKATVKCQYVGTGDWKTETTVIDAPTREIAEELADQWAAAFDLDGYYPETPVVEPAQ